MSISFGFAEFITLFLLIISIWGQLFIAKAKKRFIRLFKEGNRVQAKIIEKPLGRTSLRKSILHYPDINNGLHVFEYEFTDDKGNVQKNASYISEETHKELNIGDEIEVCVDKENGADNKILLSIQRDELACNGIRVVLYIVIIAIFGIYMFISS